MLERYTAFFLTAATAMAAQAQITLSDPNNVPLAGSAYPTIKAAYAPVPAGGIGVTFDYSGLISTGTSSVNWIAPDEYSNPSAFPLATIASASPIDTLFYQVTSNGLERVGERQTIVAFDVEVPFSDPSLTLKLPITFGGTWNDNIAANYMVNGNAGTRTGNIFGQADASGLLQLPGGGSPIEVLRIFTYTQEVNNINPGIPITVTHIRREYGYYAAFSKTPVLRVFADTLNASIGGNTFTSGIEWLDPSVVGLLESTAVNANMALSPNPVNSEAMLNFTSVDGSAARMELIDATGRIVLSENMLNTKQGANSVLVNTAGILPGCYSLRLSSSKGIMGSCRFVKN
ncbi:MAG: T9SS type A sorting domain-containing protein [Flavobacteriales bacterium]|nr:T9SS type A sorting domain-containing protein [Flavobacteriales bacterium]